MWNHGCAQAALNPDMVELATCGVSGRSTCAMLIFSMST